MDKKWFSCMETFGVFLKMYLKFLIFQLWHINLLQKRNAKLRIVLINDTVYIHILLLRLTVVFYCKVYWSTSLFSYCFSVQNYFHSILHPTALKTPVTLGQQTILHSTALDPKGHFSSHRLKTPVPIRTYLVCGLSPLQEIWIEMFNEPGHATECTTFALAAHCCDTHRKHFPPAAGYSSSETCEVGQWHISVFITHPRKFCSIAFQFP